MTSEDFIQHLQVWKQELIDDVIVHYRNGDDERGRLAFYRWKENFTQFLDDCTPKEAARFQGLTHHLVAIVRHGEHPFHRFMREDGETCLAFLEDLTASARKGRVEFSRRGIFARRKPRSKARETSSSNITKRRRLLLHFVAGLLVATFGVGLLFLPQVQSWQWLQQHPNRLGLYAAYIVLVLSISYAIADSKRRAYALVSVIIPVIIGLVSILGK